MTESGQYSLIVIKKKKGDEVVNEEIEKIIQKRRSLELGDDFELEKQWEIEVLILTEDVNKIINYILKEISDENLYWISEVFEEIIEKTQSKKLLKSLEIRNEKVKDDNYKKEIFKEIEFAKLYLK